MQGRWERCMSGVRWQGGKGGRIVRWHSQRGGKVVRWQFGKDGRVSEMARREIPCVIQQWGTQGETKILPFCF